MKYEAVIGLEVHAQMLTLTKAFCADPAEYGAEPNTLTSPISLGHPGTLPMHNRKAIEFALRMGIACGSEIREVNQYARKNYFYADLPKGYQITQDKTPICTGGSIKIKLKDGEVKQIGLIRIHMEEDAGKSMHDQDLYDTLVDFNRAGIPLIEIVSEPEIRTEEEAYAYLTEIRKIVRYLDICDGNMEEGSLRCDANISVRPLGQKEFGVKVEVKNMNSISNVRRAIAYEIQRQTELVEKGVKIVSETRSFDAMKGVTFSLRTKEAANDYRYFPEPDLPPLIVSPSWIQEVKEGMPPLPEQLFEKFVNELGLNTYDANVLTESKSIALYFGELIKYTGNFKAAANWVMVNVKSYLNEQGKDIADFPLAPATIARIIALIDEGKISHTVATQKLFPELILHPQEDPLAAAERLNIIQSSDTGFLEQLIGDVLAKYPDKVKEYKEGKKSLLGLFMGEVMKSSKGKADPKVATKLLEQKLAE